MKRACPNTTHERLFRHHALRDMGRTSNEHYLSCAELESVSRITIKN